MIDRDQFYAGMGILAGAFGREIDGPVGQAYYAVLSPKLTTAQFQRAVQIALETETFWPSPAVLLAKVEAGGVDEGEQALRDLNRLLGECGGYLYMSAEQYQALPPATREAIKAVGGLRDIAMTSEERYPALRRKFAEAYRRAKDEPLKIAAPAIDERVKRLTASVIDGRARAAGERDA